MNHLKIIKGWPPRDAPSKLVQLWFRSFPYDQRGPSVVIWKLKTQLDWVIKAVGGIWAKYFSTISQHSQQRWEVLTWYFTPVQKAISHTDTFFVTYHSNVEKFKFMQDSVSSVVDFQRWEICWKTTPDFAHIPPSTAWSCVEDKILTNKNIRTMILNIWTEW